MEDRTRSERRLVVPGSCHCGCRRHLVISVTGTCRSFLDCERTRNGFPRRHSPRRGGFDRANRSAITAALVPGPLWARKDLLAAHADGICHQTLSGKAFILCVWQQGGVPHDCSGRRLTLRSLASNSHRGIEEPRLENCDLYEEQLSLSPKKRTKIFQTGSFVQKWNEASCLDFSRLSPMRFLRRRPFTTRN